MRAVLFIAIISISLFSCDKDSHPCDNSRPLQERIQGSWELTEIFDAWTQESHIPTAEERQTLAFGDSLSIIDYQNTTTVAYEIDNGSLHSNGISGILTIDCNTMVIDNTPVDGPRNIYSRILEE